MDILVVEPFMGGSHKAFLNGLQRHSRHTIHTVTMSDRYWKWRMNGGAVTLAEKTAMIDAKIDLVLASSMTNLPAFIALTNPRFANTPVLFYMHENQLTQPVPEGEERDLTYCYINYLSALSANQVIFNSHFHFDSFMQELPGFLSRFPDYHQSESIKMLESKSIVMHPGLDLSRHDQYRKPKARKGPPVIVWNQRWAFDKNPDMFFRVMNRLDDSGCDFELILAGDNNHDKPQAFREAWKRYGSRIIHYGYVDDFEVYSNLLHKGDIVVSTAEHEFFCVAIMEAIYCGCHPVMPNKLTYPELMPDNLKDPLLHAPVFYEDEDDLFRLMHDLLKGHTKPLPISTLKSVNSHLDWNKAIERYDALFENAAKSYSDAQAASAI